VVQNEIMILWFQKLLVAIVSPLTVAIVLSFIGIVLLVSKRGRKTVLLVFVVGFLFLVLPGYGIFNGKLKQTENKYKPLTNIQAILESTKGTTRYVVVLGSGHVSDSHLPATSQINGDSLFRLVEGIRVYRNIPGSRLILSGGPGFDTVPNARIMATVASEIGVPEKDMILETSPKNTEEEAIAVREHVGSAPVILVTSALHMPRAINIFRSHGMDPMPAPTDFIFKSKNRFDPKDLFPSTRNIALSEKMIYEYLGATWHRIKRVIE